MFHVRHTRCVHHRLIDLNMTHWYRWNSFILHETNSNNKNCWQPHSLNITMATTNGNLSNRHHRIIFNFLFNIAIIISVKKCFFYILIALPYHGRPGQAMPFEQNPVSLGSFFVFILEPVFYRHLLRFVRITFLSLSFSLSRFISFRFDFNVNS